MPNEVEQPRTAKVERKTAETHVRVELNIDGTGQAQISTGVGFYDHMLTAFARHGRLDLTVQATGDLHIDQHHTMEDIALVIGQAVDEALRGREGITRMGDALVPLDEALVQAVIDISGRPFAAVSLDFVGEMVG
ncbi:MAG: imidazoleglycerol-phosphate dehydratase, partial [Anaerolineales bacterium]|nr:imidazoleglycerol-phosphate dehydratase [Anaerolineales bacterium]